MIAMLLVRSIARGPGPGSKHRLLHHSRGGGGRVRPRLRPFASPPSVVRDEGTVHPAGYFFSPRKSSWLVKCPQTRTTVQAREGASICPGPRRPRPRPARPTHTGIHHRRVPRLSERANTCATLLRLLPQRHEVSPCAPVASPRVLASCRIIVHRVRSGSRPLRSWAPHGFSKAPFPLVPLPFPTMKVLCPVPAVPRILRPFFVPPRLL